MRMNNFLGNATANSIREGKKSSKNVTNYEWGRGAGCEDKIKGEKTLKRLSYIGNLANKNVAFVIS